MVQTSSSAHTQLVGFRAQEPSRCGHCAEAQYEYRPPGPAAASPRRSPRFRARLVALVLESLGEDGEGSVRGQFGAETIDGVIVVAAQELRLKGDDCSKYGDAKPSRTVQFHLGICDSNSLLQPSLSIRLFRGYRLPRSENAPALLYR